jgi:hypothetical protein
LSCGDIVVPQAGAAVKEMAQDRGLTVPLFRGLYSGQWLPDKNHRAHWSMENILTCLARRLAENLYVRLQFTP